MKKNKIILITEIVFISAFIGVIAYFTLRILIDKVNENNIKKELTEIMNIVISGSNGEYKYEDDKIIYNGNVITSKLNYSNNGYLIKDEYGINAYISDEKFCAYKTTGNSEIVTFKGKCDYLNLERKEINYSLNKASVTLNLSNGDKYNITKEDIIPNEWLESDNEKVILTLPYSGEFYLWVKNEMGVIYKSVNISITCSDGKYNDISNTLVYCTGAKINYMNYSWHVIKDENGYLTIMLDSNILDKMSHCDTKVNMKYCYYLSEQIYESYKWSNSKIKEYLNNEFINTLDEKSLIESDICDDNSGINGCIDGDGCAGYLKKDINKYKFKCNTYTTSKVRLLTYEEYNYLLKNNNDNTWLFGTKLGDFWLMNGYSKSGYYVAKINTLGLYYMNEFGTTLLNVRPVITIEK